MILLPAAPSFNPGYVRSRLPPPTRAPATSHNPPDSERGRGGSSPYFPHQSKTATGRLGGRSINLRRVLIRRQSSPASCRRLCREFPWTDRSRVGTVLPQSRRLVGAARIAVWIEPPASLPERGAEHSDDRAPLRPQADEQSLDLDHQLRARERSQTLRGLWQRLRRRRTMLATNRAQSRLRRTGADGL